MAARKYPVKLTETETAQLERLLRKGRSLAREQTRARILLKATTGCQDSKIMEEVSVSSSLVFQTRKRYAEEGLEAALHDRPHLGARPKLTEAQYAQIIATACTTAPAGHDHWTLRLLADRVVQLGFAKSFSHEAVRLLLKKTHSSLGSGRSGA